MTTPGPATAPPATEPTPPTFRPLLRSRDDRVLAGVAGGLGRWFDIDPVIFRVTFVVLSFFGGVGLIAYLIGYLIIPDESSGEALISSRVIPDVRRLSHQQRALLGWGVAGLAILVALAGHRSTTIAVLIIVAAVVTVAVRTQQRSNPSAPVTPYGPPPPGAPQPAQEYAFSAPPPGVVVPPSASYQSRPFDSTQPPWPAAPAPDWQSVAAIPPPTVQYKVRPRGRRLNRLLISLTVLAIGLYLMIGEVGAYDVTTLQATAVGLTVLGVGLAATAWIARSRIALCLGILMTVVLMIGSALQGDYGTQVGSRVWRPTPTTTQSHYQLAAGRATLDLTQLGTSAAGKTFRVDMGAGKLVVLVPAAMPMSVHARIVNGELLVFDHQYGQGSINQTVVSPGWTAATGLTVLIHLRVGNVEVRNG